LGAAMGALAAVEGASSSSLKGAGPPSKKARTKNYLLQSTKYIREGNYGPFMVLPDPNFVPRA
jgi:hypothetical protein